MNITDHSINSYRLSSKTVRACWNSSLLISPRAKRARRISMASASTGRLGLRTTSQTITSRATIQAAIQIQPPTPQDIIRTASGVGPACHRHLPTLSEAGHKSMEVGSGLHQDCVKSRRSRSALAGGVRVRLEAAGSGAGAEGG